MGCVGGHGDGRCVDEGWVSQVLINACVSFGHSFRLILTLAPYKSATCAAQTEKNAGVGGRVSRDSNLVGSITLVPTHYRLGVAGHRNEVEIHRYVCGVCHDYHFRLLRDTQLPLMSEGVNSGWTGGI